MGDINSLRKSLFLGSRRPLIKSASLKRIDELKEESLYESEKRLDVKSMTRCKSSGTLPQTFATKYL